MAKSQQVFLNIAEQISAFSKDSRRKIGAIAVDEDGKILSTGYNGFPRGTLDTPENWENRGIKNKYVVHAEANLVYNATYTGARLKGSTVYVFGLPVCQQCALALIQAGVSKVVYKHNFIEGDEKWLESFKDSLFIFNEAGVEIEQIY